MSHIFISHNHKDKDVARRVARRLKSYGAESWLDESELQLSNVLTSTLKEVIEGCRLVLVIASQKAIKSSWVQKEMAFASENEKPICPLFIEPVSSHEMFSDYLGLDLSQIYFFEQNLNELILQSTGKSFGTIDVNYLQRTLKQVQKEEPKLRSLIDGCISGTGLPLSNLDLMYRIPFHILDYTLYTLYVLAETEVQQRLVAFHAASLFYKTGCGSMVLERFVATAKKQENILASALGRKLDVEKIDIGVHLLSISDQRDDQALASFISKNHEHFQEAHMESLVFLATNPLRQPKGSTLDAILTIIKYFPKYNDALLTLDHWISSKEFDGLENSSSTPRELIRCLNFYLGSDIDNKITKILLLHLRSLARSNNRRYVMASVDYVIAASRENIVIVEEIIQTVEAAPGSHEWSNWEDALEISTYLWEITKEARGEKNFLKALKKYRTSWEALQQFESIRKRTS